MSGGPLSGKDSGHLTMQDGTLLYFRRWKTADEPKGVAVIVHGYAEHCGLYEDIAGALTEWGYDVVGYDFRGHGQSSGIRGFARRFDDYIDDNGEVTTAVREEYPHSPIYFVAHSTGCMIALFSAVRMEVEFAGLILSAPALLVKMKVSKLLIAMSAVLSALVPKAKIVRQIHDLVSRNPDYVYSFTHDPLVYNEKTRARVGMFFLRMYDRAMEELPSFTSPVLFMHGTADQLIEPGSSDILYRTVASDDKELKWWEGLAHVLFHEPERDEVYSYIRQWLEKRLSAGGKA
jgi:alpha-beta hydrolase superfamily lysophospholipase